MEQQPRLADSQGAPKPEGETSALIEKRFVPADACGICHSPARSRSSDCCSATASATLTVGRPCLAASRPHQSANRSLDKAAFVELVDTAKGLARLQRRR